jgi:hypothetical protein
MPGDQTGSATAAGESFAPLPRTEMLRLVSLANSMGVRDWDLEGHVGSNTVSVLGLFALALHEAQHTEHVSGGDGGAQ